MKGWMVYPAQVARKNYDAFQWLAREAAAAGIDLYLHTVEELSVMNSINGASIYLGGSEVVDLPDFVLMRTYESLLSSAFEMAGVKVVNSGASMEACKNKMTTCLILSREGIPTPLTLHSSTAEYDYRALTKTFDSERFIVKQTDGSKGENVFLVDSDSSLRAAIAACRGNCICQEFVSSSRGRDIRVWVVGRRAVACVQRESKDSFISNFSLGGKPSPYELTPLIKQLSERACAALGVEFAGVDLLFTEDGFTVNEVNGNAGFRTLSAVGENNIPAELFRYLADSARPTKH